MRRLFCVLFFLLFCPVSLGDEIPVNHSLTLKAGWSPEEPFAYLSNPVLPASLTGLDVEMLNAMAQRAHYDIRYLEIPWNEQLLKLKEGSLDIGMGAIYDKEREQSFYYSKPYRYEEESLFILRERVSFRAIDSKMALIEAVEGRTFRLGIVKGFLSADEKLNDMISNPANEAMITKSESLEELLRKLLRNEIDGFLENRLVGSSLIWHNKKGKVVTEQSLELIKPVHLIFSKKSVSTHTVSQFDRVIDNFEFQRIHQKIVAWYLYPVILLQTVDTEWFKFIDILGTLSFAISGVLIAYRTRASIFTAFMYAILPSVGGGLLRDILFNRHPVELLETPIYLLIVIFVVMGGYGLSRLLKRIRRRLKWYQRLILFLIRKRLRKYLNWFLITTDALGLAAFTVTGVLITLMAKAEPLWLWGPFFAFLTGALGTIVRDILRKSRKLADIEGELYSEIAIVWGFLLSVGLLFLSGSYLVRSDYVVYLVFITLIGTFVSRMLVAYFEVRNVYFK